MFILLIKDIFKLPLTLVESYFGVSIFTASLSVFNIVWIWNARIVFMFGFVDLVQVGLLSCHTVALG